MEYKTITVIKCVEIGTTPYENSMEELEKYIEDGFKISSISTNHRITQNGTYAATEVKPTRVELITTYLLVKE